MGHENDELIPAFSDHDRLIGDKLYRAGVWIPLSVRQKHAERQRSYVSPSSSPPAIPTAQPQVSQSRSPPGPKLPHDELRQSPIYRRALHTPDVMGRWPAGAYRWRKNANFDNEKVAEACLRLDHLIRNAIDYNPLFHNSNFLTEHIIGAIKAFLCRLDVTLPRMQVDARCRAEIQPRIDFCRRIVAESDQERAEYGCDPVSADWFERVVNHYDRSLDEVIYGSPFWTLYSGTAYHGLCSDRRLNDFHFKMRSFWH